MMIGRCIVKNIYYNVRTTADVKIARYSTIEKVIEISNEVKNALHTGKPIVALESTIITHGMPYPMNLKVAKQVEKVVRDNDCVPATIAIVNGIPKIGLNDNDLELLAQADPKSVIKASRRDISYAIHNKLSAGTTVAGTLTLANLVGLTIFATGGIGGVHRGAESTMDISADLQCLSQIPITTVCAGIKSILDIQKSLEVLETLSVPVISLGTTTLPAFFTNDSRIKSPYTVQNEIDIARMMLINKSMGLGAGMIVAAPNPNPGDSVEIQNAIDKSLKEANEQNIHGSALTPFILARVQELTHGKSLDANVSLILNNAKVASIIALEYSKLTNSKVTKSNNNINNNRINNNIDYNKKHKQHTNTTVDVVVVGGAVADFITKIETKLLLGSSNPGSMTSSYGGVGRNVAQWLGTKGVNVKLLSVIGGDNVGQGLLNNTSSYGVDVSAVSVIDDAQTASYTAIHDSTGDLSLAVADMKIFNNINDEYINRYCSDLISSKVVVIDGNISFNAARQITSYLTNTTTSTSTNTTKNHVLIFEPTSDHKCLLPFLQKPSLIHMIDIIKPNLSELRVLTEACLSSSDDNDDNDNNDNNATKNKFEKIKMSDDTDDIGFMASILLNAMESNNDNDNDNNTQQHKHVIVSLGKRGVIWSTRSPAIKECDGYHHHQLRSKHYYYTLVPSLPVDVIGNTNGAGDAFLGGFIAEVVNNTNRNDSILDKIKLSTVQAGLLAAKEKLLQQ